MTDTTPKLNSVHDAALHYGVSPTTIYRWEEVGRLERYAGVVEFYFTDEALAACQGRMPLGRPRKREA